MTKLRIMFVAAFFLFLAAGAHAQVIVIANSGVNANSVSKAELGRVFTGASTRLLDGSHVTPALLKDGAVHNQFLSDYIDKSPIALIVVWRGLVLSGQGNMPKAFDSEEAMVEYVARTPGAIGYIGKATPHTGVKVLTVD
jgi:ABC-type phosphate transport system substrate-binding protein